MSSGDVLNPLKRNTDVEKPPISQRLTEITTDMTQVKSTRSLLTANHDGAGKKTPIATSKPFLGPMRRTRKKKLTKGKAEKTL